MVSALQVWGSTLALTLLPASSGLMRRPPQLTVIVRDMPDEDSAAAVTDWAAPIDTTEPAEDPEGWSGGRAGAAMMPEGLPTGHNGALYAVSKDNKAVVVFTDQEQSIKAELIAKEVIATVFDQTETSL